MRAALATRAAVALRAEVSAAPCSLMPSGDSERRCLFVLLMMCTGTKRDGKLKNSSPPGFLDRKEASPLYGWGRKKSDAFCVTNALL